MGCNANLNEALNILFVLAKNYKKRCAILEFIFGVFRVVVKCYIDCGVR